MTASSPSSLRWLISQIGSRELYACPVSFQRRGHLRLFYTDAWCPAMRGLIAKMPAPFWGLLRRFHDELPRDKVVAFTTSTMMSEISRKLTGKKDDSRSVFEFYGRFGSAFAKRVAGHMRTLELNVARDVHFAFSTGAYESLLMARERGITAVLDQLDPGKVDEEMIREESQRWPDWDAAPGIVPDSFYERLGREWETSDLIVVNSEFSRQAIHRQGVPLKKLVVVPLAYEAEGQVAPPRPEKRTGPLHVLWLGQVILRKGIPYLFDAARRLEKENIRFTVAGRLGISDKAVKSAPANMDVRGRVTREEAVRLYQTADVFVLPTISDGFAITQIEAMSHGLPVIATPHCGDVVTEGVDGFIIPIRDPEALARAIARFAADPAMLGEMSRNAIRKSAEFTVGRYADTIERAVLAHKLQGEAAGAPARQPSMSESTFNPKVSVTP